MTCCSFCSIVPPHILHHVAQSDDDTLRQRARETLALTERLRGERLLRGSSPPGAGSGTKRRVVCDARHSTALPGALVRDEDGVPSGDLVVERAFRGAGDTF